ncbi:hypothetical protein EVAR_84334_1 [Eumeta japonica]|uniref:Uncharacterized protein n=1 Tax=Eumeta variegata TaxID=151549 RepID=A0A4C1U4H6_EUMVA|nr:hypothetical protein EVAR_84334_1 [Eumeta japonica]
MTCEKSDIALSVNEIVVVLLLGVDVEDQVHTCKDPENQPKTVQEGYRCQATAFAVAFRLVRETPGRPLYLYYPTPRSILLSFPIHQPNSPSIRYHILNQETANAQVTRLRLRVFMDNGDHQLSGGSCTRLPHDLL